MAMTYKGTGPLDAKYAKGGPEVTTRSRFMKTPDVFRTSIERQDYEKKSPGGEMSKTQGESKSEKPVKPRT
jgi:hypothetical protein